MNFEPDVGSLRKVRRFVARSLAAAPNVDDVVLAASELATNVIRHANTPFSVSVMNHSDHIRLEVSDGSSVLPAVNDLDRGKGLKVIEGLSEAWGVEATEHGKTVWVEFSAQP